MASRLTASYRRWGSERSKAARALPITRTMKRVLVVAAVIVGAVVVTLALNERNGLRDLLLLLGFALVAFLAARGLWRWWKTQPAAIASFGLWVAFGFAVTGWLTVALIHAC